MALRSDIFQRDSLSGTTTVRNGFANVIVDIGPYGLTGNINFIVQLRRGSIAGEVIAATPPINIVDYSELISFAPNVAIISEGEDVRFDLLTANVPDGSTFYYTANSVSGNVDAEDFVSQITGSIIVYDNQANILISSNSVPTTAVETGEVFDIQLRLGSIYGEVSRTSNIVEILDTANVVDVTAVTVDNNSITESESVVFTIDTVNALGTNMYYTVTGNADIYTGQSGSFLVSDNQANLELIVEASIPDNETREFAVEIRRTSIAGPILSTSENISVNAYTGTANSKISLVANVTTLDSIYLDETATIRVQTINVVSDETMYYNILGVSNAEIIGGNTGSLVVTSNNNSEFPVTFNLGAGNEANATIQIRRNSNDGRLLGFSNTIPIVPRGVSGGLVVDEGADLVHIFTTTSNILISSTGAGIQASVLLVAGGGSGTGYMAGGGGAGGMLEIPVTLTEGEYTMSVGAGASGSATPYYFNAGSPSSAFGTTVTGGGRGAYHPNTAGRPGGSGGGGGGNNGGGAAAGPGIPGQGNPGSVNPPSYAGGNGYSGAGGGAGGAGGGAPTFTGGPGRISTISPENYGTNPSNSPTPGGSRYFSGGGAGNKGPAGSGIGGVGGGGNARVDGATNTGGGGGGNPWSNPAPTSGGSGIIMVRYPKP